MLRRKPDTPPDTTARYRATGLALVHEEGRINGAWLARQVGISKGHLYNVVHGHRTADHATASAVAAALALPFFLLFEYADANDSSAKSESQPEGTAA